MSKKIGIDEKGREIISKEPLALKLGLKKPESLQDKVRRMIRLEASLYAEAQGKETFEEADDFDVGDDFDPTTPYEVPADNEGYSGPTVKQNGEIVLDDSVQEEFKEFLREKYPKLGVPESSDSEPQKLPQEGVKND